MYQEPSLSITFPTTRKNRTSAETATTYDLSTDTPISGYPEFILFLNLTKIDRKTTFVQNVQLLL